MRLNINILSLPPPANLRSGARLPRLGVTNADRDFDPSVISTGLNARQDEQWPQKWSRCDRYELQPRHWFPRQPKLGFVYLVGWLVGFFFFFFFKRQEVKKEKKQES